MVKKKNNYSSKEYKFYILIKHRYLFKLKFRESEKERYIQKMKMVTFYRLVVPILAILLKIYTSQYQEAKQKYKHKLFYCLNNKGSYIMVIYSNGGVSYLYPKY